MTGRRSPDPEQLKLPACSRTDSTALGEGARLPSGLDTERLQALLASEAHYRAVLTSSLDPLVTIDVMGTIVSVSSSVQRVFGYEPEDIVGQNVMILIPESHRGDHLRGLERYRSTGVSKIVGQVRELEVLRKDGMVISCELSFSRADVPGQPSPFITGSFRDITRRKRAEREVAMYQRQLRALASELVVAEEQERHLLAEALHDGLSQTIVLARLKLSSLHSTADDKHEHSLREIGQLLDQAQEAAKSLTFQLSPSILYDLGLVPALEWLAEDIQHRHGLRVTLERGRQDPALDQQVSLLLFRAVRELLINVVRHANASQATVRLSVKGGDLCINVEDEGRGFDPSTVDSAHFGLFSIRERLRNLGGSLDVRSAPGQGTIVVVSAPLRAPYVP